LASLEALLSELKDERENALMLSTLQLYLKRSIHRLIRNVLYQMARGNEDADAQYTDLLDLKWMKEGTFYSHTRSFFPQAYDFKIVWEEISWQGTPLSLERIQLLVMHSFTLARQRSERELEHSPQTEKNKKALFGKISDIQQKREAFRVQYDIPEQKISGRNIITLA
ncbi:MAG: hypothetical protein Q8Q33_08285, partial [Chlamydiota bacterium]|nr:hypothetical protein [Chlamydiota bacterium]